MRKPNQPGPILIMAMLGISLSMPACDSCHDRAKPARTALPTETVEPEAEPSAEAPPIVLDPNAVATRKLADEYWTAVTARDLKRMRSLIGGEMAGTFDSMTAQSGGEATVLGQLAKLSPMVALGPGIKVDDDTYRVRCIASKGTPIKSFVIAKRIDGVFRVVQIQPDNKAQK